MSQKLTKQVVDGGLPWTEFIAKTLNLSVEEAKTLIKYDNRCKNVSALKAKKVIDFLLSEGFNPQQVSSLLTFLVSTFIVSLKFCLLSKRSHFFVGKN